MNQLLHGISLCSPAFAMLFATLSVNLIPLRRDRIALRVSLSGLGLVLIISSILLIPEGQPYTPIAQGIYCYVVYLSIGLCLLLCCKGTVFDAAYVCAIGQLWQHLLYSLSSIIFTLLEMSGHPVDHSSAVVTLTVFFAYAAAYLLMFLILPKVFRSLVSLQGNQEVLIAGLLLPIPLMVMNLLIISLPHEPLSELYLRIDAALLCVIAYLLMLSLHKTRLARLEADQIREANLRLKEQYEFKKEVIDQVNIRAHDLKKQLSRLEATGAGMDLTVIEEIRRALSEYDGLASTGNEALDLILGDASGRCRQAGIRFTWLLDGKALGFLEPIDLYAIFGNLLDNAITAASDVPEPENRMISLNSTRRGDFLYVTVVNSFANALSFEGQLPKTTKKDAANHGFGMKSVRSSLKKYGGEMRISVEDQLFNVSFMLKTK